MARSLLADSVDHNVWATLRLLDVCDGLTEEQLATAVLGTYGSILDTMRHLVGADAGYLATLTNDEAARVDEDSMSLAELREVMDRNGPAWSAYLATDPDPDAIVIRRRDDGSETHASVGIRLAQAVHHGTDHRSQICTALTALGIEPPEIDVWSLAWEGGRLTEVEPTA